MGMTSNKEDIRELTGKYIGKVYLGHGFNKENEYDAQTEGERVLDCKTGNFHLFPVLINEDEREKWINYQIKEKEVRDKLQRKLQEVYPAAQWGNGTLMGIPEQYMGALNRFFCCMQIKEKDRYYTILFKRFFVDKVNKVNCIYGDVQFISSTKKGPVEFVNEFYGNMERIKTYTYDNKQKVLKAKEEEVQKIHVNYPNSYLGQNEKMIRFSGINGVNVYNPKGMENMLDVSDIELYVKKIAEKFYEYIRYVEKRIENTQMIIKSEKLHEFR